MYRKKLKKGWRPDTQCHDKMAKNAVLCCEVIVF